MPPQRIAARGEERDEGVWYEKKRRKMERKISDEANSFSHETKKFNVFLFSFLRQTRLTS